MLTRTDFHALLETHNALVIDGGLATELETRGHDLNHALWSAKLLQDRPDGIERVHRDYHLAGADVAITTSYQASVEGFREHFGLSEPETLSLIKRSVELARRASETAAHRSGGRPRLVAGSVGPYGAYLADGSEYRGDYARTREQLQGFHRPRIQALVDAGVDLLALETIPQLTEIEALLDLLRAELPGAIAWLSCTLVDAGHISDGTCLEQVLRVVNQYQDVVVAVGVNCVPVDLVTDALKLMKRRTRLPLLCYPNSGEVFDSETKTWSSGQGIERDRSILVREWRESGARLIGGCCRTGPGLIDKIARTLSTESIDQAQTKVE